MAIRSMTGFSRAQGAADGHDFAFELRSVNGRGLDLRFRLPAPFDALEPELRARAQKKLSRGNVQIGLTTRRAAAAGAPRINEAVFAYYAEIGEKLAWSAKLNQMDVGDLIRLPGVIETGEAAEAALPEAAGAAALAAFDAALDQLVAARAGEGAALAAIIAGQFSQMESAVAAAETADATRGEAIKARLKAQVEALLGAGTFDGERLHLEAALIASRIDVREEIDRLKAHIAQGRTLLAAREPVGRKLDFLSQEFVREANTLCSKANDIALTRIGLDLKAVVEQFREQVQNIE